MSTPDQRSAITAKILKLCHGNKETVVHLFAKKRSQFPAKNEIWVLSMVLWDLERSLKAIQPVPTQYTPPSSQLPQIEASIPPYDNPLDPPTPPTPTDYAPTTPQSQQYPKSKEKAKATRKNQLPPASSIVPDAFVPPIPPARSTHYSAAIETKLIRLCQGDRKTAQRLVAYTRREFYTRDEQWIWEKTVWDLERDRH